MAKRRSGRRRVSGGTTARGYGNEHQKLRKQWAAKVEAGGVTCPSCGLPIHPGEAWDLGHVPGNKSAYLGPQHASCNRNTTAERGRMKVMAKGPVGPTLGRRRPSGWRSPEGRPNSQPWTDDHMTEDEWWELPETERTERMKRGGCFF